MPNKSPKIAATYLAVPNKSSKIAATYLAVPNKSPKIAATYLAVPNKSPKIAATYLAVPNKSPKIAATYLAVPNNKLYFRTFNSRIYVTATHNAYTTHDNPGLTYLRSSSSVSAPESVDPA